VASGTSISIRDATILDMASVLDRAAARVIANFRYLHDEQIYGFAFVAPPEGTWVTCAFATEEGLTRVAADYARLGYRTRRRDPMPLLRSWLRRANPDDGWHWEHFSARFIRGWRRPYRAGELDLYDGSCAHICAIALRCLERRGVFGHADDDRVTAGFTFGDDPRDFVRYARHVNSRRVFARLRAEIRAGEAAEKLIRPPRRDVVRRG
jgi:hypothetical protein